MRTWADVAQLVKTRNLDGSFVVRTTAGFPFLLQEGMEVALVPPQEDLPRRVTVERAEDEGGCMGVVRFAEVTDPDTAHALVGSHCLVRRDELPDAAAVAAGGGIAGWEVHDICGELLGAIVGIVENPAQSLIEVERPDGSTFLIPLVDEFIFDIDEDACVVTFDLPLGLTKL